MITFINTGKKRKPKPRKPKYSNYSASSLARKYKNNPSAVFREERVFYHWLGLELLKVHAQAEASLKDQGGDNIDLILGEDWTSPFRVTVSREAVNHCSKGIKRACEMSNADAMQYGVTCKDKLKRLEVVISAMVATTLQKFFFEKELGGAYYHQWPTRKRKGSSSPELTDGAAVELNDGIPGRSVLASDIKRYSMREAVIETARYYYSMMEEKHDYSDPRWPMVLGLPTKKEIKLYIFLIGDTAKGAKLKGINVIEGQPWDPALLLTTLVAVRFLLSHPIIESEIMRKAKPLRMIRLQRLGKRVFLDKKGGKVWKFFMSGTAAKVNLTNVFISYFWRMQKSTV